MLLTRQANRDGPAATMLILLALLLVASREGQVEGQRYHNQLINLAEDPNTQQQQQQQQQQQTSSGPEVVGFESGERVDKLASPSGDQIYQIKPQLLAEWYRQLALSRPEVREAENNQYQLISADFQLPRMQHQQQQLLSDPTYNMDYRALVNEFKRQSPLANPSRESRAFKPKLMSTARGFGKRAGQQQQRHTITYGDLLAAAAAANPALVATNGKMSPNSMR